MAEIPYWVPLVSAFAGGGLIALINFVTDRQRRKSDERRHIREVALKVAFEYWKQHIAEASELAKQGTTAEVLPLDAYVIHILKLSEYLIDKEITKDNIITKLKEIHELDDIAEKCMSALNKRE